MHKMVYNGLEPRPLINLIQSIQDQFLALQNSHPWNSTPELNELELHWNCHSVDHGTETGGVCGKPFFWLRWVVRAV